jgi:hypothetical protein
VVAHNCAVSPEKTYDRPRVLKLGVKAGQRVSVLGVDDPDLVEEMEEMGADVSTALRPGSDIVFFAAETAADLARVADLREHIVPAGAIWVVRRKGAGATLKETDVIDAGLAARMVDNKIVSFSDTHGAMRLVIRLRDRP